MSNEAEDPILATGTLAAVASPLIMGGAIEQIRSLVEE
jgi:hypothetical protein